MKTLILGNGEIGKSLFNVLVKEYTDADIYGSAAMKLEDEDYDIMHIAFPYSEKFVEQVEAYKKKFKPRFIVNHSTVPVGTSRLIGAVHSPCVGIHPDLAESMLTFDKFLGGEQASDVAQYFRRCGMKVYLTDKQETTEFMKMQSTTFYGVCIEFNKELKRKCRELDIPFELWTVWTQNYNAGYTKLGHPEFTRPLIVPIETSIGGHCVRPNLRINNTKFAEFMIGLEDYRKV